MNARLLRRMVGLVGFVLLSGVAIELSGCATAPPPPPLQAEVRPLAPHAAAVWVPGHWQWKGRARGHVWVPGHWKAR